MKPPSVSNSQCLISLRARTLKTFIRADKKKYVVSLVQTLKYIWNFRHPRKFSFTLVFARLYLPFISADNNVEILRNRERINFVVIRRSICCSLYFDISIYYRRLLFLRLLLFYFFIARFLLVSWNQNVLTTDDENRKQKNSTIFLMWKRLTSRTKFWNIYV